jgi:hypothetical protein
MSSYPRDTEVELRGTFLDTRGEHADPAEVTLEVRAPDGTRTAYASAAEELTWESEGVYTKTVLLDQTGTWYYRYKRFNGTSAWNRIDVIDDPFV